MEEKEIKGQAPDLKGKLDVAAWYNTDKNGKTFLSVVFGKRINLYQVEKTIEVSEIEDIFE